MSHPMHVVAILPVRELAEAVAFWSRLPSVTVSQHEGGGYAFVLQGEAEVVHLAEFPDLSVGDNRAGCYVHVSEIDAQHARCVRAGLPVSEIRHEPWGMREFRLSDPSGNLVRLGCPG